ncbi:MAG: sugar ABC transporter permease [Acutalibacteraceae bacterium]|nr:sugar ABC transporter permease [Acutalibacteraceae bacterium]
MNYIDYIQLNPFQKFAYNFKNFFASIPGAIAGFFKAVGKLIVAFFVGLGDFLKDYVNNFKVGTIPTKLSYVVMGAGCFLNKQIVKGLVFLALEVAFFAYMIGFGGPWLSKFGTLGTIQEQTTMGPDGMPVTVFGDNSMLILLFGTLTLILIALFVFLYILNIKVAISNEKLVKAGETPNSFAEDFKLLLDEKFHVTLLTLPTTLVGCFTILPLIFMILIAFTNFDGTHQPPNQLFTWVGFGNFTDIFINNPKYSMTFGKILGWTLTWAVVATFSCYILGVIVALMINKKGLKFKGVFRTCFVMAVAVPQFVTLLLMNQMLSQQGVINVFLQNAQLIEQPIKFLSGDPTLAKIVIIVVNIWIGIPYTILSTTGILMNIPEDLYESARIDGATPIVQFMKITLPYLIFVTTPQLISTFVGNINNFNVIFLLSGGGPQNLDMYRAGETDLLVTWLYKLTMGDSPDNNLAASIGILVFIICGSLSLITFNNTKSAKDEGAFS